jgi:iron complex outermembrane recepter protein
MNRQSLNSLLLCLAVAVCTDTVTAGLARADNEAADSDSLAEITVTVQRRAQSIEDVGTSITAFRSDDIQEIGSHDISQLVGRVPSLQYNQYSPIVTIYNIRGVSQNDFADHLEAPIAVYVDDAYLASMGASNGQMFDVSGVEVARGPQGTLFGRNATGGLIHITTAKPTDTPDGYASFTGGSFGQYNSDGAYGGPITDGLRGRISFENSYNDGYVTNRLGYADGNMNEYGLRLQLEADIGSDAKFLLSTHLIRDLKERAAMYAWQAAYPGPNGLGVLEAPNQNYWNTCPGCDAGGYKNPSSNPYNQAYNGPDYFDRTVAGATGTFTVQLPIGTLVSITDYSHLVKSYAEDSDASPNDIYDFNVHQGFNQYSEELRLSNDSVRLHWTTGLFYLHIRSNDLVASDCFVCGDVLGVTPYVDTTSSWAAYGQTEYQFAPMWSGILGARYSSDRKKEDYSLYVNGVLTSVFNPAVYPDLAQKTFDGISGKAELDFKPTAGTLIYASYNRGTKAGGFSAPNLPPVSPQQEPYDQEVLTDYEGGYKLTLLDGKLRFNGDAFYYDYHNYQAFSFFGVVPAIKNQDALIKGAEFELAARPFTGLTAELGASFLHTEVKHVLLPDLVTYRNTYMPQAPAQSFNARLRYDHALGAGIGFVETDWKHDGSQYFTSLNNPDELEPSRTYGNVRAGYEFGGHWSVSGFVNNVTDKVYDVYRFDFSGIGISQRVLAKPRWYGITVSYKLRKD